VLAGAVRSGPVSDGRIIQSGDRDVRIDFGVAHTSRVYDYLLGGTDNFAVDREAAEAGFATYPGGLDGARTDARANRAYLGRAVRFLAGEAGIRQFLDIGTGIPTTRGNVHEVAQEVAPEAHVVYTDNDPIVLAHAHALLKSDPAGDTRYIDGDVTKPEIILEHARRFLDFSQPVGLILVGLLHVIPDEAEPYEAVATLVDAIPSGSYLALSHVTSDVAGMDTVTERLDERMRDVNPPRLRSLDEVTRFFDGLELVEPGITRVDRWRPSPDAPAPAGSDAGDADARQVPIYAGVARKP
jgi:hypothetical protein